jgi:hypothetical protein
MMGSASNPGNPAPKEWEVKLMVMGKSGKILCRY